MVKLMKAMWKRKRKLRLEEGERTASVGEDEV